MPIPLNTREFHWIKRSLDAARDSIDKGWYQSALLELRKPAKRLDSQPLPIRLQAIVKLTQAEAWKGLNNPKKEKYFLEAARKVFEDVNDDSKEYQNCLNRLAELS